MNPYLLPTLEFGPVVVRRELDHIAPDRLDRAAEPGRFTPREVIAHLADWEPISRGRIESALREPGSAIEAFDEVEMARANGYAASDPHEQCDLFARERAATAALLRRLGPEDWTKTVFHPERGILTVADQANALIGHDLYHIEQLSASLGAE